MEEETGSKQQMMYFVETLAAGTSFAWSVILQDVTDAELEAFVVTLAEFSKAPYIGGKRAVQGWARWQSSSMTCSWSIAGCRRTPLHWASLPVTITSGICKSMATRSATSCGALNEYL